MSPAIGIDPGAGGAIAIIDDDKYQVEDIPNFIKLKKTKRRGKPATVREKKLDEPGLIKLLDGIDRSIPVFVERVGVMPGQGNVSGANFIGVFQFIRGVLMAQGFEVILVTPQTWKKHHGIINSGLGDYQKKKLGVELARKLFPMASLERVSEDCDRADALLIASYGVALLDRQG